MPPDEDSAKTRIVPEATIHVHIPVKVIMGRYIPMVVVRLVKTV